MDTISPDVIMCPWLCHVASHLILTITLLYIPFYYPHCTDEETKAQRLKELD